MGENKKYYAENIQENEDVYILHPGNAIIYKDENNNEEEISHYNDAVNSGPGSTKMQLHRLVNSHSMMLSKIIETQMSQPPFLPGQMSTNK